MRRLGWAERLRLPAMYGVLMLVAAMFFLSFFDRFAGLRSGDGEFEGGVSFLRGLMPYRDYFTTGPPLNTLKSALLLKVFGSTLFISRAAGVVERLVLGGVVFGWMGRVFRRGDALVAAVVTIVLSAGDRTDPLASYNHDAILWAVLSGLFASFALSRRRGWWGLGAGAFAALSALTKQTVGLGSAAVIVVSVAVLLWRMRGFQRSIAWCGWFALGLAGPVAGVVGVLWRFGVLRAFVQMLFVKGPAAKAAHASDFVVREFSVAWGNIGWVVLGGFVLGLSWRALRRFLSEEGTGERDEDAAGEWRAAGWVLGVGGGVMLVCEALRPLPALHDFTKSSVYYTFAALSGMLAVYAVRVLRGPVAMEEAQEALMCAVGWAVAFTLSLSWPAFEAMLVPGMAFVLCGVLRGVRGRRAKVWCYVAMAFAVGMQVREKLDLPFGFDAQEERPVREATEESTLPELRGMRLPRETVAFLDGTVGTIRAQAREGETIFTYPEMGLLYTLSGRTYPTMSGSHNIDVLNDSFAQEEAGRLRAARPAVIVYYRLSEEDLEGAEKLWRRGRRSGQRKLIAAIEEMLPGYRREAVYRLKENDPEIEVWVRR